MTWQFVRCADVHMYSSKDIKSILAGAIVTGLPSPSLKVTEAAVMILAAKNPQREPFQGDCNVG